MATARYHGFDSRSVIGLVRPRSVSRNIHPHRGGVCFHWIGGPSGLARHSTHSSCRSLWRRIQRQHMVSNGWADVAYTMSVCPHGVVLAGRGAGVRTAAQGTNDGNNRFYAICLLLGTGERASKDMIEGALWAAHNLREQGNAGLEGRPHAYFRSTQCPGSDGRYLANTIHNRRIALSDDTSGDIEPSSEGTDFPLVGDWNGNGRDTIGVRRGDQFMLRNGLGGGGADIVFHYGTDKDYPIVGPWGSPTGVGIRRSDQWLLRRSLTNGVAQVEFYYGMASDIPLVGNWSGRGIGVGIYRGGDFFLKDGLSGGRADYSFRFGRPGDIPLVGDWNGNGKDTIGVFRDGMFYLRNILSGGAADISFVYGRPGDVPLSGRWTGRSSLIGVRRGNAFYLRNSLSGGPADVAFIYGR